MHASKGGGAKVRGLAQGFSEYIQEGGGGGALAGRPAGALMQGPCVQVTTMLNSAERAARVHRSAVIRGRTT